MNDGASEPTGAIGELTNAVPRRYSREGTGTPTAVPSWFGNVSSATADEIVACLNGQVHVPTRTLYPHTPILFCAATAFMLYSSVAYAGRGALLGVAVARGGRALLAQSRRRIAADQAVPDAPPAPGGP